MNRLLIISAIWLSLFSSCSIFDKPEEALSYVKIQDFSLETTSLQGSNSHKITDVWVYVDDNLEGVWELPATIPFHYQGEHNVKFYAGIKKNGVSANRDRYPFYEPYELSLDLIPDSVINLTPVVTYKSNINIWLEDFEDPGIKFNKFQSSDTSMFIVSNPPYSNLYEGDAGAIVMNSSDFFCEMRTNELSFNNFPKLLEEPAYMELNYKCNSSFIVGLLHKDGGLPAYAQTPLITFNPTTDENGTDQWNKTYLYITDVTNFYPAADEFDLYISVINSDATDIAIFLDNIKVIF